MFFKALFVYFSIFVNALEKQNKKHLQGPKFKKRLRNKTQCIQLLV